MLPETEAILLAFDPADNLDGMRAASLDPSPYSPNPNLALGRRGILKLKSVRSATRTRVAESRRDARLPVTLALPGLTSEVKCQVARGQT